MYGAAYIGFLPDGDDRNSGAIASRRHASGLVAAISLNPAHSSASSRAWVATVWPRAARNAVSMIAYCAAGMVRPAAISIGGMISAAGTSTSSGATSNCSVSDARVPAIWARRSRYLASPPTTSATSSVAARDRGARARDERLLEDAELADHRAGVGAEARRPADARDRGSATCRAARGSSAPLASNDAGAARSHACAMRSIASSAASGSSTCWWATPAPTSTGVRGSRLTAYFRWKFGVRFSANAFGPSLESSDPMTAPV